MDGTLYLGDEVFPGAVGFIRTLERTGRRYIYLTNNSSRAGEDYVNRLRGLGFPCEMENVVHLRHGHRPLPAKNAPRREGLSARYAGL